MSDSRKAHCSNCDAEWGGYRTAHCPTCHITFKSVSGFDAHRSGPAAERFCLDPTTIGMAPDRNGYWRVPADSANFEKIFSKDNKSSDDSED